MSKLLPLSPKVTLQVPARLDYGELATRTVALVCKVALSARAYATPQRERLTHELMSAVGEAFNNVVVHGYVSLAPGQVTIATDFDSRCIVVEVLDDGASFDPEQVQEPELDLLPESGLGLFIMRSFADLFEYRAGAPNVLRLTKFLPPASALLSDP